MDPGRSQSEGNSVDPFSWPLDTFSQIMPGVDKVIYVIVLTIVYGVGLFLEYILCFTLSDLIPKMYIFRRLMVVNPDLYRFYTN